MSASSLPRSVVLSRELFEVLAGVLSIVTDDSTTDDVVATLQLLQAARPDLPELSIALAQRYLVAGELQPARDVLEAAQRHANGVPLLGALLAYTLHAQKDPAWRLQAFEAERATQNDLGRALLAELHGEAPP